MAYKPGQLVYFTRDHAIYAGVIQGWPVYRLGLRSIKDRRAEPFRAGQRLEGAGGYAAGTRFEVTESVPRLAGDTYSLDISDYQTPSMLARTLDGADWVWDAPTVLTIVESCQMVYPVRGQHATNTPTVEELDAEGSGAGELYTVLSADLTWRLRTAGSIPGEDSTTEEAPSEDEAPPMVDGGGLAALKLGEDGGAPTRARLGAGGTPTGGAARYHL